MLDHFHGLEKCDRLYEGYRRCFSVAGRNLLLICTSGEYFLIENRCPHMDWPLDGGVVADHNIECPKHRIRFDLNTGLAIAPGTLDPLQRFDVVVDDGCVGVDLRQLA